jgi:aldehyde dehydrogenase (NAD+)
MQMETDIVRTLRKQKEYFRSGETINIDFRLRALRKLRQTVIDKESKIMDALRLDLGKSAFESYASEIGLFLQEIRLHIKNLKRWARPVRVKTPLHSFPAKSFIYPEPYGVVLIVSPWNFPFLLLMVPLVGAISSGNCAVVKPAHYSENTSNIIEEIVHESFEEQYVSVFKGGREVNEVLLNETYDYIFFTGSMTLGKLVMERASASLTPVTLELGGKSPAIVDADADLDLAAKRIAWGKLMNAGQTCVCPDHVLVHESVKDRFIKKLSDEIDLLFSKDPSRNPDYGRIITETHWKKLRSLYEGRNGKGLIVKGTEDLRTRTIPPVVLSDIDEDDPSMKEEIFGPILPVLGFSSIDTVIEDQKKKPRPLALYLFGKSKAVQDRIMRELPFGGGCINDTILHFTNPYLPFGGVGSSGMGSYHGKSTFDTFTHHKSILVNSSGIDIPVRYPPYSKKLSFLKRFLK